MMMMMVNIHHYSYAPANKSNVHISRLYFVLFLCCHTSGDCSDILCRSARSADSGTLKSMSVFGAKNTNAIRKTTSQLRNSTITTSLHWIEWKKILASKGLINAANYIARTKCKYCDRMQLLANRMDREIDECRPEVGNNRNYDGEALKAFTKRMSVELPPQFGIWPQVYERAPTLRGGEINCVIANK